MILIFEAAHRCVTRLGHPRGDDFSRDVGFLADDQVGIRSGRFQVLVMHGPDCIVVLADDAIQTSARARARRDAGGG